MNFSKFQQIILDLIEKSREPVKAYSILSNVKKKGIKAPPQVYRALEKLIKNEDKQSPYSDDAIVDKLTEDGYTLARRTIAKYRDQMGFPVARLRKEI